MLKSRKSKNIKEINSTVKELIEGEEVLSGTVVDTSPAKSNLPMVIYDKVKIDTNLAKPLTHYMCEKTPTESVSEIEFSNECTA